jgi:hypothetical protein
MRGDGLSCSDASRFYGYMSIGNFKTRMTVTPEFGGLRTPGHPLHHIIGSLVADPMKRGNGVVVHNGCLSHQGSPIKDLRLNWKTMEDL